MTRHLGDWSNHDADRNGGQQLDYAAIARDGIVGGWHKTSDGLKYYSDPYWPGAIGRMKSAFAGGVYGSYHVLWGNVSITGQCDWWMSILDSTAPGWRSDPRFAVMTDNEPFGYNTTPTIDQVNAAGDYIKTKTGKVMLAYCPPWVYGASLARLRYPLVSSNYGSNPMAGYRQAYAAAGGDASVRWTAAACPVRVLQYGSQTIQGPYRTCDANAVRDADWTTLFGGAAVTSPTTTRTIADEAAIALTTGNPDWKTPAGTPMVNVLPKWQTSNAGKLDQILAKLDALATGQPAPVTIDREQLAAALADPAFLAAVGKAVVDEMYRRMQA